MERLPIRSALSGFALLITLFVLAALFALATPYLLSMRQEHASNVRRFDHMQARTSATAALEHTCLQLQATHPAQDVSPLYDDPQELSMAEDFRHEFFQARNPRGEIWSAHVEDEQAKINLNSAPPQVLAKLFGFTYVTDEVRPEATTIKVVSTQAFPEQGELFILGEIVRYSGKEANAFLQCERGVSANAGKALPARNLNPDDLVYDRRIFDLVLQRVASAPGLSPFATIYPGTIPQVWSERFSQWLTVYSSLGGADPWGAPIRCLNEIQAGKGQKIQLQQARYVNVGSTVRIWGADGKEEYALVVATDSAFGPVTLHAPTRFSYRALEAQMQPLLRHPINVNTADPTLLMELLEGLELNQAKHDSLTLSEAQEIAARIVAARPLQGFEDFAKRIVLPALAQGVISQSDAWAIFLNALNADDAWLKFSSLPFTFATGDIYSITASASINADSGKELARQSKQQVLAVCPPFSQTWSLNRQDSLLEQYRLTREARQWRSGPENVARYEAGNDPPSIFQAVFNTQGTPIYPSADSAAAFISSAPYRKEPINSQEYFVHFDEENHLEGKLLSEGIWSASTIDANVMLADVSRANVSRAEIFPGAVEAWFRSPDWVGTFFDLGNETASKQNRITLKSEENDLVFQVFDIAGDDPLTQDLEAGEVRFPLYQLPANTWSHLSIFWQGNRPSDLLLMIDGVQQGTPRGLTHVTEQIKRFRAQDRNEKFLIPVESTAGFPDQGVLCVGGSELVEYVRKSAQSFEAAWSSAGLGGSNLWIGGRGARMGVDPIVMQAVDTLHEAGEGVELYGYSSRLISNLPGGGATLANQLGRFSAAKLIEEDPRLLFVEKETLDPIGTGILDDHTGPWRLAPLDVPDNHFSSAFALSGGFALVIQMTKPAQLYYLDPNNNQGGQQPTPTGENVFGIELIHYASRQGDTLHGITRGLSSKKLSTGVLPAFLGKGLGYVTKWLGKFDALNNIACGNVFVIPVSIPAHNLENEFYQYLAVPKQSSLVDIVQITNTKDESKTEWVQYDEIMQFNKTKYFVKTEPQDIDAVLDALGLFDFKEFQDKYQVPPPGCSLIAAAPLAGEVIPGKLGILETANPNSPVYRIWKHLKHRGVLGTYSHAQALNSELIPIFHVQRPQGFLGARPGRNDRVALLEAGPNQQPAWHTIAWAYYPDLSDGRGIDKDQRIYVAFKEQAILARQNTFLAEDEIADQANALTRIVKFPSGELGIDMDKITVGGALRDATTNVSGELDEIEFFHQALRGRYVLQQDVLINSSNITVAPRSLVYPHQEFHYPISVLTELPADAGVVKIDNELLAYIDYDATTGVMQLAPNGRGLLNSLPAAHGLGTAVTFMPHIRASELQQAMNEFAANFAVEDPRKFPSEGTLFIDDELIHYTHKLGQDLSMPKRILAPSPTRTAEEEGIFRGRYGTTATAHADNSVVIHFPFRYWDRFAAGVEVAELSFYGCHFAAPDALFESIAWQEDVSTLDALAEIVVMARVDDWLPWSAASNPQQGLFFFSQDAEQSMQRLDYAGNRLALRFFTRYLPGAFDAQTFQAHSWKKAPRVQAVHLNYQGATQVLWKTEYPW